MASKLKTCSLIEQRAVIRLVTAEGVKKSVIHRKNNMGKAVCPKQSAIGGLMNSRMGTSV